MIDLLDILQRALSVIEESDAANEHMDLRRDMATLIDLEEDARIGNVDKEAYINDLFGVIQARDTDTASLRHITAKGLQKMTLAEVQALHELIVYCETH